MTIVKARRHQTDFPSTDHSCVPAHLLCNDDGREERIVLPATALQEALARNRGMGILDVQLPGELHARHVIINRFAKSKDGKHLTHLVLKEVSDTDRIRARVPVVLIGLLTLKKRDRLVVQKCKAIDLRGPVSAFGQPIHIRVSSLVPGDVIRAKDVELPEGVVLCSEPETEIVRVLPVTVA